MAWYSLLPSHLTTYETWIVRIFLGLAIINIAPWILFFLYDFFYYVGRQVWHEIPIIGGRAQGAQRPRAPSLRDRKRRVSFRELVTGRDKEGSEETRHRRDISRESIPEEHDWEEDRGNEGT